MALAAADLTYPAGEIRPEWFSGENLAANLALWLTQGYTAAVDMEVTDQSDADAIARAYGYWRAYDAKAHALGATPNSVSIAGEVGVGGFTGQAKFFREKAAYWKSEYTAAVESAVAVEETAPVQPIRPSVATRNVFTW